MGNSPSHPDLPLPCLRLENEAQFQKLSYIRTMHIGILILGSQFEIDLGLYPSVIWICLKREVVS